jgi:uncharacterized membrane protein YsdA (DUF1294 family)
MNRNPIYNFTLISLGLAIALTIFLWWRIGLELFIAWLVAINITAFLVYGADKTLAEGRRTRVPEKVLLLLALLFGSLGAWIGMQVFRHKTSKQSFQVRFWIMVAAQIVLVILYFAVLR